MLPPPPASRLPRLASRAPRPAPRAPPLRPAPAPQIATVWRFSKPANLDETHGVSD